MFLKDAVKMIIIMNHLSSTHLICVLTMSIVFILTYLVMFIHAFDL